VVARSAEEEFVHSGQAGSGSAPADCLAVAVRADLAVPTVDVRSALVARSADSLPVDSLAVLAPADSVERLADAHCARAAVELSDSDQADWLAVSRADSAAPTEDDHSAQVADLDDSDQADSSAVSRADSAAPTVDAHPARAAELDDSDQADSLAVMVPAGSAAPMTDDWAEQDLPLQVAHSEEAGCPDGSPAGSQLACLRVGPVGSHLVGSQAGSPDVPYLASLPCPEAPASRAAASQPRSPDAESVLRSLPTVGRDAPPGLAAV